MASSTHTSFNSELYRYHLGIGFTLHWSDVLKLCQLQAQISHQMQCRVTYPPHIWLNCSDFSFPTALHDPTWQSPSNALIHWYPRERKPQSVVHLSPSRSQDALCRLCVNHICSTPLDAPIVFQHTIVADWKTCWKTLKAQSGFVKNMKNMLTRPPCCQHTGSLAPWGCARRCQKVPWHFSDQRGFHWSHRCYHSKVNHQIGNAQFWSQDWAKGIDLDFSMISQEQTQCLTRIALLAELGFHIDLCDKRSSVIVVGLLQPADFSIRCHFSCNISNCSGSWTENEKRTLLTTARFVDQISIFSVAFLLESIGQIQQETVFWMRFRVPATSAPPT